MNVNIKYLKDENGNVISPVVNTSSIFKGDNNLTNILNGVQDYTTENSGNWIIHKYKDNTYECIYPHKVSSDKIQSNVPLDSLFKTENIFIQLPITFKQVYYYNLYASFTSFYSFPVYWITTDSEIAFSIICTQNITSNYRLSINIVGKVK